MVTNSLASEQNLKYRLQVELNPILPNTTAIFFTSVCKESDPMEIKDISRNDLREIMKEAVAEVLTERKDLLEEAVSEAILDMKLASAMEEADTGEYVSEEIVLARLKA